MDKEEMQALLADALGGITAKIDEQATAIAAVNTRLDEQAELAANTKLATKREAVAKEFGDVVANSLDEAGLDAMITKIGSESEADRVGNKRDAGNSADPLAGYEKP